jgi:hypothetical protein
LREAARAFVFHRAMATSIKLRLWIVIACAVSLILIGLMVPLISGIGISGNVSTECTYDRSKRIASDLQLGGKLEVVVAYLDERQIGYLISSSDGRTKISLSQLQSGDHKVLHPINILVLSKGVDRGLVKEDEQSTLQFDRLQQLVSVSCKKVYTGP